MSKGTFAMPRNCRREKRNGKIKNMRTRKVDLRSKQARSMDARYKRFLHKGKEYLKMSEGVYWLLEDDIIKPVTAGVVQELDKVKL